MTSRLRVGLDATSLLGVRTGIGQLTAQLVEHLARCDEVDVVAYAITWRGRRDLRAALPAQVSAGVRRFPARLTRALWRRVSLPRVEHWTGAVDVVHATNYVAPPSHAPVLVSVPDLTCVHYPELGTADTRTFPGLIRVALDRGATVHTLSDFVAAEIRECFGVPPDRVVRIYPGLASARRGDPPHGRKLAGTGRYVLALGTVEPRKNLPALVRAFDAIAGAERDLRLVVAGPDGWGVEAYAEAVAASRHPERVRRLGYVTDAERAALLAGATILAYPSRYEGFGFPPLEAMQAGVPVVASSAGALPEVLGDAALLPDPHDVDALAEALTHLLNRPDQRAELIARGHQRAGRYRWEQAAPAFVATYRRLASEHPRPRLRPSGQPVAR
jgi:glycosyltransferase involved in cell wall biosynthesis